MTIELTLKSNTPMASTQQIALTQGPLINQLPYWKINKTLNLIVMMENPNLNSNRSRNRNRFKPNNKSSNHHQKNSNQHLLMVNTGTTELSQRTSLEILMTFSWDQWSKTTPKKERMKMEVQTELSGCLRELLRPLPKNSSELTKDWKEMIWKNTWILIGERLGDISTLTRAAISRWFRCLSSWDSWPVTNLWVSSEVGKRKVLTQRKHSNYSKQVDKNSE